MTIISNMEQLTNRVRQNTKNREYYKNNAMDLGQGLGMSRNRISQVLNDCFKEGRFIKINTRPVIFIDKNTLEEMYHFQISKELYSSFDELRSEIECRGKSDFKALIGHNGSLRAVFNKCKASISYPPNGLPTLLYGETGTGKSTIVKKMFEYGINHNLISKNAKYIHVNCSEYANNPELITANLFGYKKGAFTGADFDNPGLIKNADGGMLFLDEVHCLKPECQEKLFLFMDNGEYRMMGDTENVYHSKVLLSFATTEDPEKALLKTLLRRIPIQIYIPSLEERGQKEKSQIIVSMLAKESEKLGKEIRIGNNAYNNLLNCVYSGNVGELKNVITETCMNALFKSKNKDVLDIHTLHLPDKLISNNMDFGSVLYNRTKMIPLSELESNQSNDFPMKRYLDKLIKHLLKLQNNQITMDDFIESVIDETKFYTNSLLFEEESQKDTRNAYMVQAIKNVYDIINAKYGYIAQGDEIYSIFLLIKSYYQNEFSIQRYEQSYREELDYFCGIIEKKYAKEYQICKELVSLIATYLDVELDKYFTSIYCLIMNLQINDRVSNHRINIILSHGYATASSIANAVNQMLGHYIFDALDMPLDVDTEMINKQLNAYLSKQGNFKDLVLLVDMGSLEDIYEGVLSNFNCNVAIANNVNTRFALSIGEGIEKDLSLDEIFESAKKYNKTNYKIIRDDNREKVILCSCATGIGTAEKLRTILEDSLPKSLPVKIITYDYSSLIKNKLNDDIFKLYEVICIVGTLNPKIENMRFIPIEELIMNESFNILTDYFKDDLRPDDMAIFQKNILKNFSLSNIIGNLTFLNPTQLLERVAVSIDLLQSEMDTTFSNNICFGLYVHVCCLVERLVTREGIGDYHKTIDSCPKEFQKFYKQIKYAFNMIEKYYRVEIPIEEIEYIEIYIRNMLSSTNNEDDE